MHTEDTIIHRISPTLSNPVINVKLLIHNTSLRTLLHEWCFFVQFFHSKYFVASLALLVVFNVASFGKSLLFMIRGLLWLVLTVCAGTIWNYSILQYSLVHSFDLRIIFLSQLSQSVCAWVIISDRIKRGNAVAIIIGLATTDLMTLFGLPLLHTVEGIGRISHRRKQVVLLLTSALWLYYLTRSVLKEPFSRHHDVFMHIVGIQISLKDMILVSRFNLTVFMWKKLIQITKHPKCIFVATYPEIVWMTKMEIGMRRQTLSSVGLKRTASMSLDIYKQSVAQNAKVFFFEDNSIAHSFFRSNIASSIHQIHFAKCTMFAVCTLFIMVLSTTVSGISTAAITAEICCILLLLIGPFTFDMEMMRFYLKSFDFWFKLFNWTMYMIADAIWSSRQTHMDGVMWTECAFRNLMVTIIIFYIICIDAYHVQTRYKKRALIILIALAMYYETCILLQIFSMNPSRGWDDEDIVITTLAISQSLRSTMLNTLGNFILFMSKQLFVMIRHPGCAAFGLFPHIEWIGENQEQPVQPAPDLERSQSEATSLHNEMV